MPLRPGALPVREPDWFDSHFPGDFIVEYIGADPRLVLHPCTCWPRRCSTGRRSRTASSTACCWATTARSCPGRLRNYPDPTEAFEVARRRRHALGRCCRRRRCGAADMVADRRSIEEAVRQVLAATLERLVLPHALRQRGVRASATAGVDGGETVLDATPWPRPGSWSTDVTVPHGCLRPVAGSCRAVLSYLDSLNNWYIRRARDRFWAGDAPPRWRRCTPSWRSVCRVTAPLLPLLTDTVWPALDRRAVGATWPTGPRSTGPCADPTWWSPWTPSRRVLGRLVGAAQLKLQVRLRVSTLTVSPPDVEGPAAYVDPDRRGGQREGGGR